MKSLPQLSVGTEKRIKLEAKKYVYEANEKYNEVFDATILWMLHRDFGFGKKRLRKVYDSLRKCYAELKEMYSAENDELLDIFKYKLKEDCGIDIEKWNNNEFD